MPLETISERLGTGFEPHELEREEPVEATVHPCPWTLHSRIGPSCLRLVHAFVMELRTLLLMVLALTSCGVPDADSAAAATLTDASEALTDDPSDVLFELTFSTLDEPLALADVLLTVGEAGATATSLPFELEDNDGDELLSDGDVLIAVEPEANILGVADSGTAYEVELFRETGGNTVESVWSGEWTAD